MRPPTPQPTRALTLRVPIANEEERALFQRRLALTGFIVFALAFGFFIATLVSVAFVSPTNVVGLFTERPSQVHLATSALAGIVWLAIRNASQKRSVSMLGSLDLVISVGVCIGWAAMALAGIPLPERPEKIALLACSYTLVVRAALIPSAPARTAVLGVLSMAPLVVMTSVLYRDRLSSQWGLPPALDAAIWGLLGVAATTVISYIIYGLRQQVRKAMQLGQYFLEEKIGEGGMGVVYRASHAMLRRPTAIKLLSGSAAAAAARFEREVQITARLTHPNTVAVFDYGRTPEGVFYYAMEYLEGISLEDLVALHGPQPARRVAHILLQMCGALSEAHAAGLVHRDIKPANVMLTERGGVPDVVKVLDFGLVMEAEDDGGGGSGGGESGESGSKEKKSSAIMGTPHYMAPEAITTPEAIDARADLYAVGATAYYLLVGQHVFEGTTLVEICSQHLHDEPKAPSAIRQDVPKSLEKVILACLAKKPDDRPKDAAALASMIRASKVGEWAFDEAHEWWATTHKQVKATSSKTAVSGDRKARPKDLSVSFTETMAIALDDRAAS